MYQKIIITGRLGADVKVRRTSKGTAVANVLVITDMYNRVTRENDQQAFRCVVFGAQADAAGNHIGKGHTVTACGRMQEQTWEDDEGNRQSRWELICDDLVFVSAPANRRGRAPGGRSETDASPQANAEADAMAEAQQRQDERRKANDSEGPPPDDGDEPF